MKTVYEAAHAVEAHMIVHLLRQDAIAARVEGEYLLGAAGALPAGGLVRVVVDDGDAELAQRAIERWNAAQVQEAPSPRVRSATSHWSYFVAGLSVGLAMALFGGLGAKSDGSQLATGIPLCRP